MPSIEELFVPCNARAKGFETYAPGEVAYVTNGLRNNGVRGYVKAKPDDIVFTFMGVVLSAFCEATVQIPPFLARGNGGSGLMVLKPREAMTGGQLAHVSAYINTALRWRFNWYRQATVDRVRRLPIPNPRRDARFGVGDLLSPSGEPNGPDVPQMRFKPIGLSALFEMEPGEYHNAGDLPPGKTPLVSCGDLDNGIMAFVDVPESSIHYRQMTIAFNGDTLTTKYHPYQFAAKDDVAVCTPVEPLRLSTLLFIQLMMNREKWRYSYYRKCFMEKLKRQCVYLPVKGGGLDEDAMQAAQEATPYWEFIRARTQ